MQHGHTVANVFTVVLRYVVVMMVLFHSYNPFNYLSPIQKPWKPENVWATYFRAAYRILYYLWLAHIAAGIITSYSVRWIGMSLLLNPSLYEALQILPNVALFLLFFVKFHAQLLFKIALFLLNFLNSTCATFNRCTTFIKISQLWPRYFY